ncbi:MAG TPA: zinc metallopeptidase [Hyphomicrobiaceae bacterium]|nr:zinc metallopeptidase [Hyphomicrobiaceae bacterium]
MLIPLFALAVILTLAFLPQLWVRNVIARHSRPRPDLSRTGSEFARHLLDRLDLAHVKVEESREGDHYDPEAKAVRLTKPHYRGRSLAAVVIAAHEVGHAIQDATGYAPLRTRLRLARQAERVQSMGAVLMLAAPIVGLLAKSPFLLVLELVAGLLMLSFAVLIHAVTLPVEFDASFRRALPMLEAGRHLHSSDKPAARQILRAAALTYVAAAAISLLDVMRWIRLLRF